MVLQLQCISRMFLSLWSCWLAGSRVMLSYNIFANKYKNSAKEWVQKCLQQMNFSWYQRCPMRILESQDVISISWCETIVAGMLEQMQWCPTSLSSLSIHFQCFLPLHPFVALAPWIALLSCIRGFGTWRFNKSGNCVPSPNSCAICFFHQLVITDWHVWSHVQ